jgi:phosphoglucosamine mutase
MRQLGLNVGGEQSGHMILSDYATTGDGLLTALQLLAVLVQEGRPTSEVVRLFDPLPQVLKNVRYSGRSPLSAARVKRAIEVAEAELAATGRLLIRCSGTESMVRVMAEGEDDALVLRVVDELCVEIAAAAAETAQAAD